MEQLNVLLIGKTGDGKSRTGNTILEGNFFQVHHGSSSSTFQCHAVSKITRGRNIKIIDSPGFFNTELEERTNSEIVRCIAECSPGIHALVIVLKAGKYTEQEMDIVKKITDMLGEEVLKYAVVLFTNGEQLEDESIEQFVEQTEKLKELVQKCGGRYHIIDNRYWNQEHVYKSNRVQVEKLLNTMEEMVTQNGGCYTNEMLHAVEAAIQEEEREIRNNSAHEMSVVETRKEAIVRVIKKLMIKLVGLTVGALVGALLGIGVAVVAAAVLAKRVGGGIKGTISIGEGIVTAAGGIAAGCGAGSTGLYVVGGIVGVSAAAGAIGGSIVGFQAVDDGDSVGDAVKKTARANWENAKYTLAKANQLSSKLSEVLNTTNTACQEEKIT